MTAHSVQRSAWILPKRFLAPEHPCSTQQPHLQSWYPAGCPAGFPSWRQLLHSRPARSAAEDVGISQFGRTASWPQRPSSPAFSKEGSCVVTAHRSWVSLHPHVFTLPHVLFQKFNRVGEGWSCQPAYLTVPSPSQMRKLDSFPIKKRFILQNKKRFILYNHALLKKQKTIMCGDETFVIENE